jgi:hypothetical protein
MFVNQNVLDERRNPRGINRDNSDRKTRALLQKYMSQKVSRPEPDLNRIITKDINLFAFNAGNNEGGDNNINNSGNNDKNPKSNINVLRKFREMYLQLTGTKCIPITKEEMQFDFVYYKKFIQFECLNALLSFLSIVCAIAHYEFSYYETNILNKQKLDLHLYFCSLLSILLWINLYFYERTILDYNKKTLHAMEIDNLFTSGQYQHFLINFGIAFLHPNPLCEGKTYTAFNNRINMNVERTINSVLCIIILLRFYFIIRYVIYLTSYMDPKTDHICKKNNFHSNLLFSIKSLIQGMPFLGYPVFGLITVYFFTFSVRVFERGLSDYNGQNMNNFFNTAWYVLITMTTVGYGDYAAKTNEGRIIVMIACIFGSFLISFLLLTLANFLNHSRTELQLFRIIERAELNEKLTLDAKGVVKNFGKCVFKKVKMKKDIVAKNKSIKGLLNSVNIFKDSTREIANNDTQTSNYSFNVLGNGITYMDKEYQKFNEYERNMQQEVIKLRENLENIYLNLCKGKINIHN